MKLRRSPAPALLALLVFFSSISATAKQIYNQPANFIGSYAWLNDTRVNGRYAQEYDSFVLASDATLTRLARVGRYFNPPGQGSITQWTLKICPDVPGLPGVLYPDLDFPPQWGWGSATGGDGSAYHISIGNRNYLNTDLAFSLYDNLPTVPEPGALVLPGTALLAAAGIGRRRFS